MDTFQVAEAIQGLKRLKIYIDDTPESPREWDNIGTMVCFHRRYNLGDEHEFRTPDDIQEFVKENPSIVIPLYLYDHSGITMNTVGFGHTIDPGEWDSGQVGWIYVTLEKVRKEHDWKLITKERRKRIQKHLLLEVETYDQYLTGQVFGFIVEKDGEDVNSCWGFYDENYMIDEVKGIIDYDIKQKTERHVKQLKAYIRHKVSLDKRKGCEV